MADITPQDLGSSLSVLKYLLNFADINKNVEMYEKVNELLTQYNEVIKEPDPSDMTILPYNRRDAYSILEYLKLQAEQLSEGRWTDFSDGDIGTVFLRMLAYLADMNNYQVDKVVSELYLSTVTERASAIALCSLIGYEPRHYESAYATITLKNTENGSVTDGTIIPAYSIFTDGSSSIYYSNLNDAVFYDNKAEFDIYQGELVNKNYTINNISSLGRIYLDDYNVGTNTMKLTIDGVDWELVDDVRYATGNLCYSIHINVDEALYIQLPNYWPDMITRGTNISLKYLRSDGTEGRIGKDIITKIVSLNSSELSNMRVSSCTSSTGGYNPETVDELKNSVPKHARTMNTIVTINDFEEVSSFVPGISSIAALDYNDPASGLKQPDDYYKVYMYVLPDVNDEYDPTNTNALKYRNTLIKEQEDWKISDLEEVAEDVDTYSVNSIAGNTLVLEGIGVLYGIDDVVPVIDTGIEETSYIMKRVINIDETSDKVQYKIEETSSNTYTLTFNSNWKSLVGSDVKVAIYYKQEQVLTDVGQQLREYIDERRLTSLNVTYQDRKSVV